jgi:hypothetical protein
MDWNEIPHDPRHAGVPSGASQMISEPTVHSMQTVHLSCVKISTISKWIKTRFHMTPVTKEFHRVRPKWFLSLWYVRWKPCTDLTSKLALSLNGPKRASSWALSPRSTTRSVQNDFWAYGTRCKSCTYRASRLALSPYRPKWDFRWPTSPRRSIWCVKNNF